MSSPSPVSCTLDAQRRAFLSVPQNKPMGSKYGQAPNYGSQYNCINNGIGGVQGCSSSFGGGSFFGRRLEDGTQAADEAAADNSTDDGEGVTARHRRRLFEVPYSINSGMCQNQNSQCNAWQWKGPQDGFYYTGCFSDLYTWSEFENFGTPLAARPPPPRHPRPHTRTHPPRPASSPASTVHRLGLHPLLRAQRAACTRPATACGAPASTT